MTLKEAHEIQRRELISLRAENARLKKQLEPSFPVEEKLSLERHVRHLEQVIQTKDKRLKMMYFSILDLADKEYSEHPPDPNNRDGFNLQKRLREYANAHLYFLDHPDVDYTNNISERELRKFKRKQKQSVVFRSTRGAECVCDALTIIETARMQNQCVFSVVKKAFQKSEQSNNTKFCKKSTTILRPFPYYRRVANH